MITNTNKLFHEEEKLLKDILKNGKLFKTIRENKNTIKFYDYNHRIARIDFSRCGKYAILKITRIL